MTRFEFRAYRVRLHRYTDVRLDGRAHLVDLDLNPGVPMEVSARRLAQMYDRLVRLDGADPTRADGYHLQVTTHPEEREPFSWVPTRPDDEDLR